MTHSTLAWSAAAAAALLLGLRTPAAMAQDASQDPADVERAPAGLPPGAAATVDGEPIGFDEYEAYLVAIYGRRPLDDLIMKRLVEREAARVGVSVSEEELHALSTEFWDSYVQERHRGNEQAGLAEIANEGFGKRQWLDNFEQRSRRDMLAARICEATREVTEEMVHGRFDQVYGRNGDRVELRHIFVNRGRVRADLLRNGVKDTDLTSERIEAELQARAAALLEGLRAGEDFETLARENSHDLSVHQYGGLIPDYNYVHYGELVAEAARTAEIGVPFGPVRSVGGLHVLEVLSRTHTDLEDVREEIVALLVADPASQEEKQALERRLREAAEIVTY